MNIHLSRMLQQGRQIRFAVTQNPISGTTLRRLAGLIIEFGFLLADLLGFPRLLIWLNQFFKPNTRPLNSRERVLGEAVFGHHIDFDKVQIDEHAWIGCRHFRFAYVGFNVINSWGALSDQHLIHELVHVWQYQQEGSRYIPRALWAQWFGGGYNYGGHPALQKALAKGQTLRDFNYEQQGDIVADYFCLKQGLAPRWCSNTPEHLKTFTKLVVFTEEKQLAP